MTIAELISRLSSFDPETRVMMQDRVVCLVSMDIKDIGTINFCDKGEVETIVQLVPEY